MKVDWQLSRQAQKDYDQDELIDDTLFPSKTRGKFSFFHAYALMASY